MTTKTEQRKMTDQEINEKASHQFENGEKVGREGESPGRANERTQWGDSS